MKLGQITLYILGECVLIALALSCFGKGMYGEAAFLLFVILCTLILIIAMMQITPVDAPAPQYKPTVPSPYYTIKLLTNGHICAVLHDMHADAVATSGLKHIQSHLLDMPDNSVIITPTFDLRCWSVAKRRERSVVMATNIDRNLLFRVEGLHY